MIFVLTGYLFELLCSAASHVLMCAFSPWQVLMCKLFEQLTCKLIAYFMPMKISNSKNVIKLVPKKQSPKEIHLSGFVLKVSYCKYYRIPNLAFTKGSILSASRATNTEPVERSNT